MTDPHTEPQTMPERTIEVPRPVYPGDHETLPYHRYHVERRFESKFISGLVVRDNGRGDFKCPRCKEKLPGLDHGEDTTCPECNLRMQLYGNGLHIWEGQP